MVADLGYRGPLDALGEPATFFFDEEQADPLVALLRVDGRIRPRCDDQHIGFIRVGTPVLAAVDDPRISVSVRATGDCGQI